METSGDPADRIRLKFAFRGGGRRLQCELLAVDTDEFPRPAEYAFDGALCRRRVEEPGYRFFWDNGLPVDDPGYRRVPATDPMALRVRDFLEAVALVRSGERPVPDPTIADRQEIFHQLLSAHAG